VRRVALLITALAFSCLAQAACVGKIHIDGLQRVERETVLSYLTISPQKEFSQEDVDASLKALFGTGLFWDVRLRVEGKTLYVKVVERPIISKIAFEGNDKISDKSLKDVLRGRIAARQVLNRAIAQEIAKDIQQAYQARGRFSASVVPQIIRRPENRVDLIFAITEGPPATIKRIIFAGNKNFSSAALLGEITTKEERWWRFWSYDDIYTPERLEADKRLLRKFYQKHGYADFKVLSSVAELSIDRKDFFVTFVVEEGARYTVSSVSVQSEIRSVNAASLVESILLKKGEVLDASLVEKTVHDMENQVGAQGYAFAEIEPKMVFHRPEKTVEIVFLVKRGPKNFVQRIEIEGNSRTLDSVIRREIQLHEGDPLNATKLRKSIQDIRDLDFFADVRVQVDQGDYPNMQIIKIDVEEKSTGSFKLSAGVSTSDGVMGMVGYEERNFLGHGQAIELNCTLARRYRSIDFDICQPYFLDRPLLVGLAVSTMARDRTRVSGFKGSSHSLDPYIGYSLSEKLRQRIGYKISWDNIEEYQAERKLSYAEKERFGKSICSQMYSLLTYSDLDSRHDPARGYCLYTRESVAGLGGNVQFFRVEVGGSYYVPLKDDWVFVSRLRGGTIWGGRLWDRFSLGGDDFRGFAADGIGPRERQTSRSVHGRHYYLGTFLLRVPIGATKDLGLRGIVFSEYGSVWGTKFSQEEVYDDNSLRISGGVGIEWFSPFGPISISITRAFRKASHDRTEVLQFTRFIP
jgi:outer membrane protein insertion porin family